MKDGDKFLQEKLLPAYIMFQPIKKEIMKADLTDIEKEKYINLCALGLGLIILGRGK